jgi:cell division protein FtsB
LAKRRKGQVKQARAGKRFVDVAIVGMLLLAIYFAIFGGDYTVFQVGNLEELEEASAAELVITEAEIDSLEAVAWELENDPEAIERVARESYGMVKDGEILYRFREPAPADSVKDDGPEEVE